jgi:hypothetical protein
MKELTEDQKRKSKALMCCSWCKEEFTDNNTKHRHHKYYNGEYVATICQKCNIREGKYTKFIPIIAHNSTYDTTLMIKELAKNM